MVGVVSYGVASAAFLSLLALLVAGWISRHWTLSALIVTSLCWSMLGWLQAYLGDDRFWFYTFLEFTRDLALFCLISDAIHRFSEGMAGDRNQWHLRSLLLHRRPALFANRPGRQTPPGELPDALLASATP